MKGAALEVDWAELGTPQIKSFDGGNGEMEAEAACTY
jgi:hypothetical protein